MSRSIRLKLYLPIILYITYIETTLFISAFGPAEYRGYEKDTVFVYMLAFSFVLIFGYYLGVHLKCDLNTNYKEDEKKIISLCENSLIISCIGVLLFLLSSLIGEGKLVFSFENIGANYMNRDSFHGGNYPFVYLYRFFTGIFRYVSMCFSVLYYERIKSKYKLAFWIFIILFFLENCIIQGTQKNAFDLFLFAGGSFVLKYYRNSNNTFRARRLLCFIVLGGLLLFFLSYTQYRRYSLIGVTVANFGQKSSNMSFDENHIFFDIFGDEIGFGLAAILCGYLGAGYSGLSLCLTLPFEWTYGIGNSLVLSKFIKAWFGYYAYDYTYLARMGSIYGRDGLMTWNTVFPWLASDLTFEGTIIVFIFIGVLFSYTWKEFIMYSNPISLLMFLTISLGLIFVPCNNQLFVGIDGFISTVCLIILWIIKHKRYNFI